MAKLMGRRITKCGLEVYKMEMVEIARLRPNNWFLDREKLEAVRQVWNNNLEYKLPPVTVAVIDGQLSLLDGHCRAYVALEHGQRLIPAELMEDLGSSDRPRRLREYFHRQGPHVGIRFVSDLAGRIIEPREKGGIEVF